MADPVEGPYVVASGGKDSVIASFVSHDILTSKGYTIGGVLGWHVDPDTRPCEVSEATAYLWAASWEMRDILRRIVALREAGTSGTGDHPDRVANDAEEILKKLDR
jgi:hypothetical protein